MAVSFRIIPAHFLVYIHYDGWMGIAESTRALGEIVAHPDYRKGMRELVDLSDLTDWERDFPAIMRHQALEAELHDDPHRPTTVVCLAPSEETRSLARIVNRAWDRSGRIVAVVVESEPEALSVLGVDKPSIAALLQSA